jgi:hypothetical protein
MSSSVGLGKFTQSTGGKVGVGLIGVAAIGLLIFEISHLSSGDESRVVPAKEVASEAQQQIDAINKMTNLSPAEKKAMIAHEQGEISTAQGQSAPNPSQPTAAVAGGK